MQQNLSMTEEDRQQVLHNRVNGDDAARDSFMFTFETFSLTTVRLQGLASTPSSTHLVMTLVLLTMERNNSHAPCPTPTTLSYDAKWFDRLSLIL